MSFALISKPEGYQPIYNDLPVICSSNLNVNKPKFKFVMDVSIADASLPFTTSLGRFRCNPIIEESTLDIKGYFNLKDILSTAKNFQTWPINPFQKQAYAVSVQMGEEYAPSTSAAAVYYSTSAFSFVGFNGAIPISEFQYFDYTNFIDTTVTSASSGLAMNFLTSLPNRKVLFSSDLNLDLLNNSTSARYIVNAYNGSTLLQSTSAAALSTFFENYKRINFGPSTLGLPANTTRYTIDVERYNGNNLVPQYEVFIDNTCTYYQKANIYYQNKYGAEDVFVFTRKSTLKSNIERKDYDKSVSLNTPYSRQGTNTYTSKVTRQHVLNTDWLTQAESDALSELIESNNVFLQFDGQFILGVKAEITLNFLKIGAAWDFVAPQVLNATKGGITSLTASFPTTSGTYTFADDFYINEIKPILVASNWNTFFDFDESGITDSQIVLRLVAKQKGTSYTLTSVTAGAPSPNDQIETSNNIAGLDEVIPQRIPVKVDNSAYDYKKKINGDLIQIELTVTEKAHYSRQEK